MNLFIGLGACDLLDGCLFDWKFIILQLKIRLIFVLFKIFSVCFFYLV